MLLRGRVAMNFRVASLLMGWTALLTRLRPFLWPLPGKMDDADFEAIAAKRLGLVGGRPTKPTGPASLHTVFQNLPHVAGAEDVLFPVDADPVGALTASLRNAELGIYCGGHMEQGKRPYMEDRFRIIPDVSTVIANYPPEFKPSCFFGVFDGHGGSRERVGDQVAEHLMKHLADRLFAALIPSFERYKLVREGHELPDALSPADPALGEPILAPSAPVGLQALAAQARKLSMASMVLPDFVRIATSVFRKFDAEVLSQGFIDTAGSTCTIATLFGDALIVINTGDSDAVLCRRGEPRRLTVQHKAGDLAEAQRIHNAGGFVANVAGTFRVAGMLEVRPHVEVVPPGSFCQRCAVCHAAAAGLA